MLMKMLRPLYWYLVTDVSVGRIVSYIAGKVIWSVDTVSHPRWFGVLCYKRRNHWQSIMKDLLKFYISRS